MRTDYGLYSVAVICFIIAALPYTNIFSAELLPPGSFPSIAITVISAALGLIFAILGYALRPKPIISIPEAHKPALPPSPPPALPPTPTEETTAAPLSEPTSPTPPQEKTAKPERKKPKTKTRRKRTRKSRKKA